MVFVLKKKKSNYFVYYFFVSRLQLVLILTALINKSIKRHKVSAFFAFKFTYVEKCGSIPFINLTLTRFNITFPAKSII